MEEFPQSDGEDFLAFPRSSRPHGWPHLGLGEEFHTGINRHGTSDDLIIIPALEKGPPWPSWFRVSTASAWCFPPAFRSPST